MRGARVVAVAAVGHLWGLLGVVLIGLTAIVRILLVVYRVLFLIASPVVVVSYSCRVVGVVAAAVRQGLDWGSGNIWDQFK